MAKNTTYDADLQSLVNSFTSNLTLLVRRAALEQVHSALSEALGGGAPVSARKRGPGRPPNSGRGSAAKEALGAALLAHISKNPGLRGDHLATALKTDVKTMRPVMLKLIAAKKIKTKGQRRGMTYYGA
jgi:hypothetical protein